MRVHSQTRMDAAWNFRNAYNEARKIKDAQDAFCAAAENGLWDVESPYPESLQWEALVDVLRGNVKVLPPSFFSRMSNSGKNRSLSTVTRYKSNDLGIRPPLKTTFAYSQWI